MIERGARPIKNLHINPWLRRDAVQEFMGFLA